MTYEDRYNHLASLNNELKALHEQLRKTKSKQPFIIAINEKMYEIDRFINPKQVVVTRSQQASFEFLAR